MKQVIAVDQRDFIPVPSSAKKALITPDLDGQRKAEILGEVMHGNYSVTFTQASTQMWSRL